MRTVIIGYGTVGKNMLKLFPESDVHDPILDIDAIGHYDVGFVCVPTDMLEDGSADTSIVIDAIESNADKCDVFCIKSTVPPGTTDSLIDAGYRVVMSPEYFGGTQHANAVDYDFVILGGTPEDRAVVAKCYEEVKPASLRILQTTPTTAELVKYGENAFLAMKVSFANEFARICKSFGVDYREWRELWLQDPRINRSHTFVYEEHPYYDSHCLTKDIPAIIRASIENGYSPELLLSMERYNEAAKKATQD